MLNRPVWTVKDLIPKNEWEIKAEEELKQKEQDRIDAMENKERRRFEREQKKTANIESDLEPERILIEQMELIKKMIGSVNPGGELVFERLRGLVTVEDGDQSTDYQLVINSNEVTLKSMKNSANRLAPEDLGFMVYGRNVAADKERMIRELLLTCRKPLRAKQPHRELSDLKTVELEKITEDSQGVDLPDGWLFDGRQYMTFDGDVKYEHPNIKQIVQKYLDDENEKIASYNRDVLKEWQEDKEKYEC
jgi:hypothetical protein